MIREIAGRQNHSVKLVRKLQQKKHRRERGLLVCEGMDLLSAAVGSGAVIRDVLVRSELLGELPEALLHLAESGGEAESTPDIGVCDRDTLEYASSLGGAADVIFSCDQPGHSLGDLALCTGTSFYLDTVGDPGNVGTIVRGALAFGLEGVICSPGTADPFGPKAMRAGMGAQFLVPVVSEVDREDLLARLAGLQERGEPAPEVWVADPHDGLVVADADFGPGCIMVLGGERSGARDGWDVASRVSIPQERGESLNVAMAGTILAYESSIRRTARRGGN